MTEPLFRDAYLKEAQATVTGVVEGGVIVDRSLFYPMGGGQPGDTGRLDWEGGTATVSNSVKGEGQSIVLLLDGESPPVGTPVRQTLDWDRRYAHMRIHTALHLLSVVIPLPVTGGSISDVKGRLDFDMPDAPEDKQAVEDALNALVAADHAVTESWITDAELEANPGLVKTMSVKPPMGQGRVRLVRIGSDETQIDLQPCGGTHVARTSAIGLLRLGKIEKKGKQNRRVSIHFAD
ncbi:misacylated tRNA(Ala) deacylase [Rubricella aquisinus]|uniref:Alanine--tRNA ligase n=1 Tax=Rubricella aquisinus TaxID=2028108 RepID=A0A840WR65_9RHOB|nr:alanyl-tRNA editing protein [Rubricella aquisinus]MBB5516162.1 misacylated tRNA(Ala) deacylase [Rubricella aquisinus]